MERQFFAYMLTYINTQDPTTSSKIKLGKENLGTLQVFIQDIVAFVSLYTHSKVYIFYGK